ncbi:MAG: Yip1 family protein [Candidatus Saccharicenans sp.]|nr:Yip1 family protein [Candidatus Saccharicenans sp.]MDI6849814.1 Yip1 family protein [Candidatus Saccharicenans sp.]
MNLVSRVQGLILKPKEEWDKIKGEPATVADIFKSYLMIMVAIPAVAQFLGFWLIGVSVPFRMTVRMSLGSSLGRAIVSYILSLASVFILALIINALAPTFSSKPDQVQSLKLAAYSLAPYYVAGIFYLIPVLSFLTVLAGLYSLYVLYLGFKAGLMETPPDKIMGYFVISLVVGIVLMLVVGLVVGAIFSLSAFYGGL